MNPDDPIAKFIKSLKNEIEATKKDAEQEEKLVRLQEIAKNYAGDDKLITFADVAERIKTRPPEKQIFTGYKGLDEILKGFRPTQLVVISAATKSGKTTFCIEMTSRMAAENPTWLPFEEGAEELVQKFLDRDEQPPHAVTPQTMTGNTLEWVEKKIIEAKAKDNSGIIFIDHLHFIVPFQSERQDLAIGHAMRELKRMAKQWNMVVVLIAHLKKTRVDKSPTLEDLRDSSFIAQEADTVIMLYRESHRDDEGDINTTNNVNVSVQANRRTGKTGNVKMVFREGRFLEQDWRREDTSVGGWGSPVDYA